MIVTIFEVHYDPENPDNFQTRLIEDEDWNTYRQKIGDGRAIYPSGLSLPRGSIPKNGVEGNGWIGYDFLVPATGKVMHHMSWIVQMK